MIIAFDAMGGQNAPTAPVEAAAMASLDADFECMLVGDGHLIDDILRSTRHNPERLSVLHAPDPAPSDLHSGQVDLSRTSIHHATRLLGMGEVAAVVSAGHAGPAVLSLREHCPRIQGIERAAIAAVIPTRNRRGEREDPFSLLLDVGASVRATAKELATFAIMGAAYARCIARTEVPSVAILSNSSRPEMGPPEIREADQILERMSDFENFEYLGCIGGQDLIKGEADVYVSDGFTGMITVRLLEGIADTAVKLAREAYDEKLRWRLGLSMLSGGLEQLRKLTDWEEYGGAPLLGFKHPFMMTHSTSGTRAIYNAAKLAAKMVRDDVINRIEDHLSGSIAELDAATDHSPRAVVLGEGQLEIDGNGEDAGFGQSRHSAESATVDGADEPPEP